MKYWIPYYGAFLMFKEIFSLKPYPSAAQPPFINGAYHAATVILLILLIKHS